MLGITLNSLTNTDSAPAKASQASQKDDIGAAKDAASLKSVQYNQEFMDKKYLQNDDSIYDKSIGAYIAERIDNVIDDNYKFETNGMELTVRDATTQEIIVKGAFNSTGQIIWNDDTKQKMDSVILEDLELEVGDVYQISFPTGTEDISSISSADTSETYISISDSGLITAKSKTSSSVEITIEGVSGTSTTLDVTVINAIARPTGWEKTTYGTTNKDNEWYNYGGKRINAPKLSGTKMKPIKYSGTLSDDEKNKMWANAMTADGSMFVWIPRFAYKISTGSHTATARKIDIIFIGLDNKDLETDSTKKVADDQITTDPTASGAGTSLYLVHPAFTAVPANGGWNKELTGIWFAKFEATGTSSALSVKPGVQSLSSVTIGNLFNLAKSTTFGENSTTVLNSHMVKNSEWGAVVYLAQSDYGANAKIVNNSYSTGSGNSIKYYTGGTTTQENIYTTNKKQSSTHNATGVYDLNGGCWEYVASYINYTDNTAITKLNNGGTSSGSLYGPTNERTTSTEYKTVYKAGSSQANSYNYLNPANTDKTYLKKGDAVWEVSSTHSSSTGAWYQAYADFPVNTHPFFIRSGYAGYSYSGAFMFDYGGGGAGVQGGTRVALAF